MAPSVVTTKLFTGWNVPFVTSANNGSKKIYCIGPGLR